MLSHAIMVTSEQHFGYGCHCIKTCNKGILDDLDS